MSEDEVQLLAKLASDLYEAADRADASALNGVARLTGRMAGLADSIMDAIEALDVAGEKREKQ